MRRKAYWKYILSLLLFGSNGIMASYIALSSYEIVFMRTLIGSLLLVLIFTFTKQEATFYKHKKDFLYMICSGVATGASWIFLYEAYTQIGVSIASLAYYCGPVIVMALAPILFNEKITVTKLIGFISVLAGVILVSMQAFEKGNMGWGLFCGGMSAIMYALMIIFNKKAKKIVGLENAMLQLCISFLTVAIFVGFKQGFMIQIPKSSIMPMMILGLLNTGIGCYMYFSAIGYLPVQTVSVCGYLEPLSAVLFSVVLLNEVMHPRQMLGAVLILGGAVVAELNFNLKRRVRKEVYS